MEAIHAVSYVLLGIYLIIVVGLMKGWYMIDNFKPSRNSFKTSVSILVPARNESANIAFTLKALIAQHYPHNLMEIIVINDHSTDDTAQIVQVFKENGVKLINLEADQTTNSYKKKAIETAIAQSDSELIITTDADCIMGQNWLSTIVDYYESNNFKMISSPVAYHEEQSIFERCQTLEFSFLIGLGASSIGNKRPSTCNGANLAYRRDTFYEVNGFKDIDDLASGDDEMLLQKVAKRFPQQIGFLKNRNAIVFTKAKPSLKAFIIQRKRWASKSVRYKDKSIVSLGICVWLFNLSILLNGIFALVKPQHFLNIFLFQLTVKVFLECCFLVGVTNFFNRKLLLVLQPITSILHVIYILYIGVAGNSGKYDWKGRTVR